MFIKYVTKLATRKQIQELKSKYGYKYGYKHKYQTITNTNTNECINEKKIHMKREKDRANGKILKGHRAVFNICSEMYILSLFDRMAAAPWCFKLKLLFQLPAGNGPRANIQLIINIFTIHPCLQDQPRKRLKY